MSLSDRLVGLRPAAPSSPDKANFGWQLRKGAQQEYVDALFLGKLDEVLDDPALDELVRGIGSREYVRSVCRGRKDKIITTVGEPLASAWAALARMVTARGQRRSPLLVLQPFVLMPGVRRLLFVVGLAVCALSYLWPLPGSEVVTFDRLAVTLAIALGAAAAAAAAIEVRAESRCCADHPHRRADQHGTR